LSLAAIVIVNCGCQNLALAQSLLFSGVNVWIDLCWKWHFSFLWYTYQQTDIASQQTSQKTDAFLYQHISITFILWGLKYMFSKPVIWNCLRIVLHLILKLGNLADVNEYFAVFSLFPFLFFYLRRKFNTRVQTKACQITVFAEVFLSYTICVVIFTCKLSILSAWLHLYTHTHTHIHTYVIPVTW
jgi:hypothetical protein